MRLVYGWWKIKTNNLSSHVVVVVGGGGGVVVNKFLVFRGNNDLASEVDVLVVQVLVWVGLKVKNDPWLKVMMHSVIKKCKCSSDSVEHWDWGQNDPGPVCRTVSGTEVLRYNLGQNDPGYNWGQNDTGPVCARGQCRHLHNHGCLPPGTTASTGNQAAPYQLCL